MKDNVLANAFKLSGVNVSDGSTFEIKNKPGLTNDDLIHINVIVTSGSKTSTPYDLQIPVSDINLSLPKCNITISGKNVKTVSGDVEINYNIGIKSDQIINPTIVATVKIDIAVGTNENFTNSANSVLQALGLTKSASSSIAVKTSSLNISREANKKEATAIELDSQKIGETLGIYNTTFSNPKLELSTTDSQTTATNDNSLTYKMTIEGKPNSGYYWDDKKDDSTQNFSFNVKVLQQTAFSKSTSISTALIGKTVTWKTGLNNISSSSDSDLETKLGKYASDGTDECIKTMLDFITKSLKDGGAISNAHVELSNNSSTGYINYNSSSQKWFIRVKVVTDKGFSINPDVSGSDFAKSVWNCEVTLTE